MHRVITFQVILTCGNYMNGGNTQRGQADGFGLDILPKLKDVKSRDNTATLLHYVVRLAIVKYDGHKGTSEAEMPMPEPSDVDKCANVNFDDQKSEIEKLAKDLDKIQRSKDKVVKESDPDNVEPFQAKMSVFLKDAKVNLTDLETLVEDCSKKFIATMKFYMFKPKDCSLNDAQPKDFFNVWSPFCTGTTI